MGDLEKVHLLTHMHQLYARDTPKRKNYIYGVASGYGLAKEQVDRVLVTLPPLPAVEALTEEEKFELIYVVVQFMRLEKRVCSKELQFCERLATTMGYRAQLITEMSSYVYSDPNICANRKVLKELSAFYEAHPTR